MTFVRAMDAPTAPWHLEDVRRTLCGEPIFVKGTKIYITRTHLPLGGKLCDLCRSLRAGKPCTS